jgi:hypothetical protein
MAQFSCGVNTLFTLLTLLTIGISTLLLAAVVVYLNTLSFTQINKGFFIGLSIALSVSLMILLYGIYASCCGEGCQKAVMSVLFMIYAVALIGIGVALLVLKSKIEEQFHVFWEKREDHPGAIEALEASFDCCGWDLSDFRVCFNSTRRGSWCGPKVEDAYKKYGTPIAGGLIGLGGLLLIGTIVAIVFVCKAAKEDEWESASSGRKNPLTSGW